MSQNHFDIYNRGRIYKEPLKKYNNRKSNTYLIAMRSQIAKEKARLLGFSRGWSVGDGDGESCA
jgi:hypothetical protein